MKGPLSLRLVVEVVGTAILVGAGTGAIVLAQRAGGVPQWELAIAWFLALLLPASLLGRWSGGHFNPAISLAAASGRDLARAELLPYVGSQLIGSFAGSAAVLASVGAGTTLGATVPAGGDVLRAFVLELLASVALGAAVAATVRWAPRLGRGAPLLPSAVIGLATWSIGPWTGSSLNPARSIAPAVLSSTYAALPVYLVAPVLGAILGWWMVRPGPKAIGDPALRVVGRDRLGRGDPPGQPP